uniref:Uncharacterized protein n=1 Tax=Arundo donax TaxID=35708 RepID=A0A0A9B8K1_ARUDO
MPEGFMLV